MWEALQHEFSADTPDAAHAVVILVRLFCALLFSGIVGLEREQLRKPAGLRTHMLVALGAAVVVLIPELAHHGEDALSRILQGTITGIGFIGAGAVLKSTDRPQVYGITTAATLWLAAMLGVSAGTGHLGLGAAATLLSVLILAGLPRLERAWTRRFGSHEKAEP